MSTRRVIGSTIALALVCLGSESVALTTPGSVLVATGNYNATPLGVLRADDFDGASPTYTPINAGLSAGAMTVWRLELDPIDPDIAYATTDDGAWKNTDVWGEGTWTQILNQGQFEAAAGRVFPISWKVLHVVPSPAMPGLVYALVVGQDTTETVTTKFRHYVLTSTDGGASWSKGTYVQYKSTYVNGTQTWVPVDPQPGHMGEGTNNSFGGGCGGSRYSIAPSPHNPGDAYVTVVRSPLGSYDTIFRTSDMGATWTQQFKWNLSPQRNYHVQVPHTDNPGADVVYVLRSPYLSSYPTFMVNHDDLASYTASPSNNPMVASGQSWAWGVRQYNSVAVWRHDRNRIFFIDNYAASSLDGGQTWIKPSTPGGNTGSVVFGAHEDQVIIGNCYTSSSSNAIRLSDDFGVTWQNKYGNLATLIPGSLKVISVTGVVPKPDTTTHYAGCFADELRARRLPDLLGDGYNQDISSCRSLAAELGYAFAGLQWGGQCWAGDTIDSQDHVADSECNVACAVAPGETCGGAYRNSVYATTDVTPPGGGCECTSYLYHPARFSNVTNGDVVVTTDPTSIVLAVVSQFQEYDTHVATITDWAGYRVTDTHVSVAGMEEDAGCELDWGQIRDADPGVRNNVLADGTNGLFTVKPGTVLEQAGTQSCTGGFSWYKIHGFGAYIPNSQCAQFQHDSCAVESTPNVYPHDSVFQAAITVHDNVVDKCMAEVEWPWWGTLFCDGGKQAACGRFANQITNEMLYGWGFDSDDWFQNWAAHPDGTITGVMSPTAIKNSNPAPKHNITIQNGYYTCEAWQC